MNEKNNSESTQQIETNGTFHSVKNSGLNLWKCPLTNGRAFSGIQEHKNNLTRCIQIVENLFYWECRPKFDFRSCIFG